MTKSSDQAHSENQVLDDRLRMMQFSIDKAAVSIFWVNPEARFVYANDVACQSLGYTREELLTKTVFDIDPVFRKVNWKKHCEEVKSQGFVKIDSEHQRKDGATFPVELVVNYFNYEGRGYHCAFARDVSDRKATEQALIESERAKASLLRAAPVGIGFAMNRVIGWTNLQLAQMTGYSNMELDGMNARQLYLSKEEFIRVGQVKSAEIKKTGVGHVESQWRRKTGEAIDVLLCSAAIDPMDPDAGYVFTALDISERKQAEARITKSLKEKEILLRELHHRVKNNMQIISSLLNLQSRNIKDKQVYQKLIESQNRIRSIVFLHEKLYRSDDISTIDFHDYISAIANHLFRSYGVPSDKIQAQLKIDNILLNVDKAISCGLIINELISNSIKYSSNSDGPVLINIELIKKGNHHILSVSDNGPGLPKNFDVEKADTLGLQLVYSLAEEQLRGKIVLDRSTGTKITVTFPTETKGGD